MLPEVPLDAALSDVVALADVPLAVVVDELWLGLVRVEDDEPEVEDETDVMVKDRLVLVEAR